MRHAPWSLPAVMLATLLAAAPTLDAHEIRPGLLDVKQRGADWFEVTWKVPMRGEQALAAVPVMPDGLELMGTPRVETVPGAQVQRATYKGDGAPLEGRTIRIEGLQALQTDVLVSVELADGVRHSAILRPSEPEYRVPAREGKAQIAWSYLRLGFQHILEGVDHLLFVLGLMLLVSGLWRLVKTITAFTVAHSITLGLATLGVVHVPAKPTEAVIALSIVFLAAEVVRKHTRQGPPGLAERWPWLVAFGFGLFHGLGFAGALSELGVPAHEVPLALLVFNVGVEAGQIAFVMAVLGLLALARRASLPAPAWSSPAVAYGIGALAAYWTLERVAAAVGIAAA